MTEQRHMDDASDFRDGGRDERLLHTTCPFCGTVLPVSLTGEQLIEMFLQDYPLQDIFPGRSRMETCMLLAGICPACWEGILGMDLGDEYSQSLVDPVRLRAESGYVRRQRLKTLRNRPKGVRMARKDRMESPREAAERKKREAQSPRPRTEKFWKQRRAMQERTMWLKRKAALDAGLPDPYNGRKITKPKAGRPPKKTGK